MRLIPHVPLSGTAASLLAAPGAWLQGQSCGYFDEPRLPGAHVAAVPDGSRAEFTTAEDSLNQPAVAFDACAFPSTPATADDPCVLGRLTLYQSAASRRSIPAVAQLNLTLFLAAPCPAVLLLTRLVIPVGWSPAAPGAAASFEGPRRNGPLSLLLAGQLAHVPTTPQLAGNERHEVHAGLLNFTFGPENTADRYHATVAVRVCADTHDHQGLHAA